MVIIMLNASQNTQTPSKALSQSTRGYFELSQQLTVGMLHRYNHRGPYKNHKYPENMLILL